MGLTPASLMLVALQLVTASESECWVEEFTCNDGGCISPLKQCDGTADCSDSSDEIGCTDNPIWETCTGDDADLIVDAQTLADTVHVDYITVTDPCLIEEKCVSGEGERRVLRFSTLVANIGCAPYVVGQTPNNGNEPDANFPESASHGWTWHTCHQHWHYDNYAHYSLRHLCNDGSDELWLDRPIVGHKNGWCVMDLGGWDVPGNDRRQHQCDRGTSGEEYGFDCVDQGISPGCYDEYVDSIECQWIDITDAADGDYWLTVATNWDQNMRDQTTPEVSYENNEANIAVRVSGADVTVLTGAELASALGTAGCPESYVPEPTPSVETPPPASECVDTDSGAVDTYGDGCSSGANGAYTDYPEWCGEYDDVDFSSMTMCCVCGGGNRDGDAEPPVPEPTPSVETPPPASECVDTDSGAVDTYGDGCSSGANGAYTDYPEWCGEYDDVDFSSMTMCCVCGGGERAEQESPAPTPTPPPPSPPPPSPPPSPSPPLPSPSLPSPSPPPPPSPPPSPSPPPPSPSPPAPPSPPPPASPPPPPSAPPPPPQPPPSPSLDEVCDEWQAHILRGGTRDLSGSALVVLDGEDGNDYDELKGYGNGANDCTDLNGKWPNNPAKREKRCTKAYRSEVTDGERILLHKCAWVGGSCEESDEVTDVTECYTANGADAEKEEWWSAWRQAVSFGAAPVLMIGAGAAAYRRRRSKSALPPVAAAPAGCPAGAIQMEIPKTGPVLVAADL